MELLMLTMVVSALMVLGFCWVVSRPVSNAVVARLPMDVKLEVVLARHRRVFGLSNQREGFQRIDLLRALLAMWTPSLGETRSNLVRAISDAQHR